MLYKGNLYTFFCNNKLHILKVYQLLIQKFGLFCSPDELDFALKKNNMPYLLGVRNGMLSFCITVCLAVT